MSAKYFLKICTILIAFGCSQTAFAGLYWGIGGGSSSWDIKPTDTSYNTYEVKDGPTFDVLVGNRVGQFAFEGELTYSTHDLIWGGPYDVTYKAANLMIAGLGFLSLSPAFELYGKLGMDFWSTRVDYYYSYGGYDDTTGMSAVVGVGMNFNISPGVSLRAEYKRMNGLGDGFDKGDMSQATVMAVFHY